MYYFKNISELVVVSRFYSGLQPVTNGIFQGRCWASCCPVSSCMTWMVALKVPSVNLLMTLYWALKRPFRRKRHFTERSGQAGRVGKQEQYEV